MNDLIGELYACAEAPERWRGLLDGLCERLEVRSAVIQVLEHRNGRVHRLWEARDSYSQAHRDRHDAVLNNDENPRLKLGAPAAGLGRRTVVRDDDIFPSGSALRGDLRVRLAALELGEDLHGVAELPDGCGVALLIHRSAGDRRPIGSDAEEFLAALMPHVRQGVHLTRQLDHHRRRSERLAELVDMFDVGVLQCDPDGRLLWANAAAHAILARSPHVTASGGRLRARRSQSRRDLTALLGQAGAVDDAPRSMQLTLGREDGQDMVQLLTVRGRMHEAEEGPGPITMLIAEPARSPHIPTESLAELFGLSAAEARLAAGLSQGLPLADYARLAGVSVGTARIQLKRALAKAGAARQSDLVRRATASAAARLRPEHTALIDPPAAWASRGRRIR